MSPQERADRTLATLRMQGASRRIEETRAAWQRASKAAEEMEERRTDAAWGTYQRALADGDAALVASKASRGAP